MMGNGVDKKLNTEEMITFCSQMTLILQAGISPFEGISMMMEDQKNSGGTAVLKVIYEEMELGAGLYEGMEKTGVFPVYACQMVQLGETSGRLDQVMKSLADYYSQEAALYRTLRHAVSYPLFMLVMMLAVLMVLMIKVMPVFRDVFLSLGMQMEGPAGVVLQMGQIVSRYSGVLIGLLGVVLAFVLWISKTEKGRERAVIWMQKSKITRKFIRKTAQHRLAFGMSMSLRSGLDPERSLEMMENLVGDPETAARIAGCVERMKNGSFFEEAVMEADIFDGMQNRMIRIGQRTGSLDQVMEEIAVQCEQEASENIWNKISMIEPTVVIVLAVLVGLILLSVMLPLMSLMSEIG